MDHNVDGMKILFWNANSISRDLHEFYSYLNKNSIDVRVEWSEEKMRILTTAGSQTKDIDPNRAYIKYQDIWTTFEPAAGALKMAIFNQKSCFFATPI
jgi:hypothetical protein